MSSAQRLAPKAPRLIPVLHADDCGLSAGITDAILACHDRGPLQRTSVVVNGAAWEYAADALRRRPRLSVALHLNLFEGRSVSDPSHVDLLVDERGHFNRRFTALWANGLLGPDATRLRGQVRLELRRQIERFLDAFADRGRVSVDGHVHYHMLPIVFDELLALCAEYPIRAMRLPRELFYWPVAHDAPRPPMVNVAKNLVLRALSRRAGLALRAASLETSEAFIGVLATGAMTLDDVRCGLSHLRRRGIDGTVEVLFHPGRARADETPLWADRPELREFYLSPQRDREAELLCSDSLARLLRDYDELAPGVATPPCEVSA